MKKKKSQKTKDSKNDDLQKEANNKRLTVKLGDMFDEFFEHIEDTRNK